MLKKTKYIVITSYSFLLILSALYFINEHKATKFATIFLVFLTQPWSFILGTSLAIFSLTTGIETSPSFLVSTFILLLCGSINAYIVHKIFNYIEKWRQNRQDRGMDIDRP